MIIFCDTRSRGLMHVPVNTGLVETIALAFPNETVRFAAEAGHSDAVRAAVAPELARRIDFVAGRIPEASDNFLRRFGAEWRLLKGACGAGMGSRRALLVLGGAEPSTLWAARTLLSAFPGNIAGVQVILHGNVNGVAGWRSRNPLSRAVDLRTAMLRSRHRRLRYVVLEKPIEPELLRHLPALEGCVDVLPHPIPTAELSGADCARLSRPVKFGFLGLAAPSKGFDRFLSIAAELRGRFASDAEFHVTGWQPPGQESHGLDVLDTKPSANRVSRAAYRRAVAGYHYICLPYLDRHYLLSASGVLLDAVAARRPVIAMRMPIVEALFREYGPIGHVCDDIAHMTATIASIAADVDVGAHARQVEAMTALRDARGPVRLARTYRDFTKGRYGRPEG